MYTPRVRRADNPPTETKGEEMKKGTIEWESKSAEFLQCTCGNDVMDSGFDQELSDCTGVHYECAKCGAQACGIGCVEMKAIAIAEGGR